MSDTVIRARIEPGLKAEATAVLRSMGLTPSDAIRLFLHRVVDEKALPFEVKAPNAVSQEALRELETGRGLTRHASVDELFRDLDEHDPARD